MGTSEIRKVENQCPGEFHGVMKLTSHFLFGHFGIKRMVWIYNVLEENTSMFTNHLVKQWVALHQPNRSQGSKPPGWKKIRTCIILSAPPETGSMHNKSKWVLLIWSRPLAKALQQPLQSVHNLTWLRCTFRVTHTSSSSMVLAARKKQLIAIQFKYFGRAWNTERKITESGTTCKPTSAAPLASQPL